MPGLAQLLLKPERHRKWSQCLFRQLHRIEHDLFDQRCDCRGRLREPLWLLQARAMQRRQRFGSGNYSFGGLINGSYTVTPSRVRSGFQPGEPGGYRFRGECPPVQIWLFQRTAYATRSGNLCNAHNVDQVILIRPKRG